MLKFTILSLFLLSCCILVDGQYFIRFINAIQNNVVNFTESSNIFPPVIGLGFMENSNYTQINTNRVNVVVGSSNGVLFNTSQSVMFTKYCTVVLIYDAGMNNQISLIPLEEELGSTSSDSSVKNQFWLRFIDLRSASYMDKLTTYPNTNMVSTTTIFAHIGYLQATPYRITDATELSSVYVRDDTSADATSFGISPQSGVAYSGFIYSTDTQTMATIVTFDRLISDYKDPSTVPIVGPSNFQSSSSFGTKIEISAFIGILAVFVSLLF